MIDHQVTPQVARQTDHQADPVCRQALAGDNRALARLLVSHTPRLAKRISRRLHLNPFADFGVEDVLQEAFLDVLRGIGTFRPEQQTSFAAWLDRVTDNRLAEMLRCRSRQKRGASYRRLEQALRCSGRSTEEFVAMLPDYREPAASELVNRADVVAAIEQQLAALPVPQRQALTKYFLEERSLDSTAASMQMTPGAVRGLIYRAKQAMRQAFGQSSRWF